MCAATYGFFPKCGEFQNRPLCLCSKHLVPPSLTFDQLCLWSAYAELCHLVHCPQLFILLSKEKNSQFTLNKGFSTVTPSTTGARSFFAGGLCCMHYRMLSSSHGPTHVGSASKTSSSNQNHKKGKEKSLQILPHSLWETNLPTIENLNTYVVFFTIMPDYYGIHRTNTITSSSC